MRTRYFTVLAVAALPLLSDAPAAAQEPIKLGVLQPMTGVATKNGTENYTAMSIAREMINDGVEGYVVSPTELAARLPALIAALYSDQRKRTQMGAAARSRAVNCFSVPAMVAGYRGVMHHGGAE